jgi:predicted Co/Zn/Cd cation transporter (cation efflux family)
MPMSMSDRLRETETPGDEARLAALKKGRWLEYFTVRWNSIEGVIAVTSGLIAGSIALTGFGFDSGIEVISGLALLWRFTHDTTERIEDITLRIVGWSFLLLAGYVAYDSVPSLIAREPPQESWIGVALAAVSLIVMPKLVAAKRKVAKQLNSGALSADAKQTEFCTYLSAILLAGLLLNAILGWSWADPVAALGMVPIIAKEGFERIRGESCCRDCH